MARSVALALSTSPMALEAVLRHGPRTRKHVVFEGTAHGRHPAPTRLAPWPIRQGEAVIAGARTRDGVTTMVTSESGIIDVLVIDIP